MNKNISKFKCLSFIRKCLMMAMAVLLIPIAVLLIHNVHTQENINIMTIKNIAILLFGILIAYLVIVTAQGLLVEYNDFLMPIFLLLLMMILLFFHVAYYEKIATEVGNFLGYCCKKETLNFRGATISLEYGCRKITPKDIPDSGKYIAEWTDDKFWAPYE